MATGTGQSKESLFGLPETCSAASQSSRQNPSYPACLEPDSQTRNKYSERKRMGGASRGRKQGVVRARAPAGRRGAYGVTYRRKGQRPSGDRFSGLRMETEAKAGNSAIGGGERAGLQSELGGALSKGGRRSKGTGLTREVRAVSSHALLDPHLEASPQGAWPLQN